MRAMNVELRHLRYFVAVAEEASFSSATRRVHVTQQVLSTQIRQLEHSVGAQLLERTSRGVRLTAAGKPSSTRPVTYCPRSTAGSARPGTPPAPQLGRLSVGLSLAASGEIRTTLLAAFQSAHPHVDIDLRSFDLTQPAAGLLDHSTDVALVRPPVAAPGLTLELLDEEPRVFVLPSDHASGRPSPADPGRRGRAAVDRRFAGGGRLRSYELARRLAADPAARQRPSRSSGAWPVRSRKCGS